MSTLAARSLPTATPRSGGDGVLRWRWLGLVGYAEAWALQRRLADELASDPDAPGRLLLLEHPAVYTLGRNTEPGHVPGGAARLRRLGAGCHAVDRGGSVTFHGPGQLVAYPLLRLARAFPAATPGYGDVAAYLRALEAALIATCAACGVVATVSPPHTGAWVGEDKIGAIGVKLSRGITQHGVALNVTTDLRWFQHIVPCGIEGRGVTSLERLGVRGCSAATLAPALAHALGQALGLHTEAEPSPENEVPVRPE